VAHYPGAQHCVIAGSDHAMSEYSDYLARVLAFCGVSTQPQ
ncbi:MAG: esterase, partial [Pseudomonadota bacterium]|nr:esterase [Pseudomonadota bacterium]